MLSTFLDDGIVFRVATPTSLTSVPHCASSISGLPRCQDGECRPVFLYLGFFTQIILMVTFNQLVSDEIFANVN